MAAIGEVMHPLTFGPPRYEVPSSRPAGSPNVLSRMPYRLAVALSSAAKPGILPPAVSAIAYAASLADTIIIEAIVWSNGQLFPGFNPMHMHSRPAGIRVTEIVALAIRN